MSGFDRSGRIIGRKFYQFLLPTVLSTVAVSLNEFVDSIIVSQLLGSDAMSMVGMGSPVMLLFAVIYTLLGVGGSVVYAEFAGRQMQDKSDRTFSIIMLFSVITGIMISVLALIFLDPLADALCRDPSCSDVFRPYLIVLIVSGVIIIPLQVLINYLPALGKPQLGTVINITANGVNLIMDYVYIRYFATGLKGAAMATLSGYIVGMIIVFVMLFSKRLILPFVRTSLPDLVFLKESVTRGLAASVSQLGFCIKISFCNRLSTDLAGMTGITIFTLCIQCVSIVSISIGGIVGAMAPIASALRGQRDFKGIRILMRKVMTVQTIASIGFFMIFELWPELLLKLYNYKDTHVAEAITGIRIFSVMFLFRGFVVIFMYYFQVISRKVYATVISIIDGFAGIIVLALIFSKLFGINGLWMSYPVLSVLMIAGIAAVNMYISRSSGRRFEGVFVLQNEDPDVKVYDASVPMDKEEMENVVEGLQRFCDDNLDNKKTSAVVAVAFEEMLAYTEENSNIKKALDMVDVLLKIRPGEILIDLRSIGDPHDPTSAPSEEYSNVDVLKKIASDIEYNYVMGMNQTRIRIIPESI